MGKSTKKGGIGFPLDLSEYEFIARLLNAGIAKDQVSAISARSLKVVARVAKSESFDEYKQTVQQDHLSEKIRRDKVSEQKNKELEQEKQAEVIETILESQNTAIQEAMAEIAKLDDVKPEQEGEVVESFETTVLRRLDILKGSIDLILDYLDEMGKNGVRIRLFFKKDKTNE